MKHILTLLALIGILSRGYSQNVGIGTNNPSANLHINGSFKITDGTQGAGKVLMSNAEGATAWKNIPVIYSVANTAFFPNLNIDYSHNFFSTLDVTDVKGMTAGINLPDSVKIDSARFYFIDNSAESLVFTVRAHFHAGVLAYQIVSTYPTAGSGAGLRTGMATSNHIVSNKTFSYDIIVRATNGTWTNLGIRSVILYYHYL